MKSNVERKKNNPNLIKKCHNSQIEGEKETTKQETLKLAKKNYYFFSFLFPL